MRARRSLPTRPLNEVGPAGPHVALVPGEAAPILRLDLPPGLGGYAREQVARRQVADRLGLAPDAIELRLLPGKDGAALIVDRDELEGWRRATHEGAVALVPDYLALPAAEGVWTVRCEAGRVLARLGPGDGFAAETPLAAAQLARALQDDPPAAILRQGGPESEIDALIGAAGLPVFADAEALAAAGHPRPVLADWSVSAADLLQSPDAAAERMGRRLRAWRAPVLLGAVALALWTADAWLGLDRTREAHDALRTATVALVREAFLPAGPILDVRTQVTRRMAELEGGAGSATPSPLDLLRLAAPALATGGVEVQTVTWRPEAGLSVTVRAPDFATVEELARQIRGEGGAAEVADALTDGAGGVVARLRLASAEPGPAR